MSTQTILYLIYAAAALDVLSTLYGLHVGLHEQDSRTNWLLLHFGPLGLFIGRGAYVAVFVIFGPDMPQWVLWAALAVVAFVVGQNLYRIAHRNP